MLGYSSATFSAQLTACFRYLARHFKTDPTETVVICFGYPPKNTISLGKFEPIDTVSTDQMNRVFISTPKVWCVKISKNSENFKKKFKFFLKFFTNFSKFFQPFKKSKKQQKFPKLSKNF
jgi:hypothetical protein